MPLAGLILAGGRSSRMGGGDKALALLAGQTLVARAAARLAPQVGRLALSANGDPGRYALPGLAPSDLAPPDLAIVADADDSRDGPLAGILAGLRWARALDAPPRALVSVAVDTPFFPHDLAARLADAAGRPGTIAVAASQGVWHPTAALWPLDLADDLAAGLAGGERRVGAFIRRHPHVAVDFPCPGGRDPFFNVNTPSDLAEAEDIARGAS